MTEIQGKSILVRVNARFELARVRVIGYAVNVFRPFVFLDKVDKFSGLCVGTFHQVLYL